MTTISAPTRPADATRDAARDERLAALAARRTQTQRTAGPIRSTRPAGSPPASSPSGGRAKRRHAARGARATALGLSLASTGGLAAFFAVSGGQTGNQIQAATIVAAPAAPVNAVVPTPTVVDLVVPAAAATAPVATVGTSPATVAAPALVPVAAPTVVQGGVFHNKWGDVQVQATFAPDGTLAEVVALQTPYRDGKSVRINDRAVPQLTTEALTIQSAQVDTVSGATYTSDDYRRSLQSAIDVANAAGLTAIA